jgi:hypothetical protein
LNKRVPIPTFQKREGEVARRLEYFIHLELIQVFSFGEDLDGALIMNDLNIYKKTILGKLICPKTVT